ncbi:MAG: DUF5615 family PIN-like protein [Algisphaera sp.]
MKFLVDAQLPRRMTQWIAKAGGQAMHTFDLEDGNRTSDQTITQLADEQGCIVITKDADFTDSHLLQGHPQRLLLISTGNLTNAALHDILNKTMPMILDAFKNNNFIELGRTGITIRG